MTEREKIVEILDNNIRWQPYYYISRGIVYEDDLKNIADALIEAGIRDTNERGWIFMKGEAIVPTPEIYNKVADLLDCPKILEDKDDD